MHRFLIALLATSACAYQASASPASEAYVSTLIEEMQKIDEGAEADFIVDNVDMQRLSRFVLGKHARDATDTEQDIFAARLDAFLRDFLSSRSEELANASLTILSSADRTETDSIITTRISSPTRNPMIMRWRVLLRDGEWRLIDVEVHGLWLAIEQRAQIMVLLDKRDAEIGDLYLTALSD